MREKGMKRILHSNFRCYLFLNLFYFSAFPNSSAIAIISGVATELEVNPPPPPFTKEGALYFHFILSYFVRLNCSSNALNR